MDADLLIALLIATSAAIASIIPSFKSLTDKRFKWYKRITVKGWLTILFLLVSVGLTFYQLFRNKEESRLKEELANRNLKKREVAERARYDSLARTMKKNFDSTVTLIVKTGYVALAKYGLRLDSTGKQIVKQVRDSSSYQYKRLENNIAFSKRQEDSIRIVQVEFDKKSLSRTITLMHNLVVKNRDTSIQARTLAQNRSWFSEALSLFQSESDNTFLRQNKPVFEKWADVTAALKRQSQVLSDPNYRYHQTRGSFYDEETSKKMLNEDLYKTTQSAFEAMHNVENMLK